MHRVFHEPHAKIIASVVEGMGEVIVHRLSDNSYRVQRVMINPESWGYRDGDLVIEGSMDDVEGMFLVESGGLNNMQEISNLQAQRLILGRGLKGLDGMGIDTFKLTDQSDNNTVAPRGDTRKELRFITEMDDVLSELNAFMRKMES